MQAYSDKRRESDPYSLPDVEVFYDDGDIVNGHARNYDSEGNVVEPGWYWWSCFPGCLPDSEPFGPFESEEAALSDARDEALDEIPDFDDEEE